MFLNLSGAYSADFGISADSSKKTKFQLLELQSFEDNLLGYTFESDDKSFIDFTISLRSRIFPFDYLMNLLPQKHRQDLHLNFAFTLRFGQYVGTRYSNPVIEKRFNPYLFFEYCPKNKFKNTTLQFGYGHESNGQAIDDSVTFYKTAELENTDINQTKDKISRGWDYWGGSMKLDFFPKKYSNAIFETEISVRYFLNLGLFQNGKEEYNTWEREWSGANYTRNEVNGISTSFTLFTDSVFIDKIRITYETGVTRPLLNHSIKLLVGLKIGNFPLSLSYRYGYCGDLAQYGITNNSIGIESFIPSFQRPVNKNKR